MSKFIPEFRVRTMRSWLMSNPSWGRGGCASKYNYVFTSNRDSANVFESWFDASKAAKSVAVPTAIVDQLGDVWTQDRWLLWEVANAGVEG